jgi:Domain of unknown function DUF29
MTIRVKATVSLYETDFVDWAEQTAQLIRAGQFERVDWDNVAEEIESLGRSDKRELKNRLEVLLQHLLKWEYQPERRGASWQQTLDEQRNRIADLLSDSPSLKPYLEEIVAESYRRACKAASLETGISIQIFPTHCPYAMNQILDSEP